MADIDDFKATFEQAIAAINRRDLDAWAALWDDGVIRFGPFSPFPADGAAALHQDFHVDFASHERLSLTPINPQYRVFGNTGVAWGHFALLLKPKDGPARGELLCYTDTLTKANGQWRFVAIHVSRMPSGS
jgi:ketosteroid isomerase-like protein